MIWALHEPSLLKNMTGLTDRLKDRSHEIILEDNPDILPNADIPDSLPKISTPTPDAGDNLPSQTSTPTTAQDTPWYRRPHVIIGGVVVVYIVIRLWWRPF